MHNKAITLECLNEETLISALRSIDNVLDRKAKTLNPEYVISIITKLVPNAKNIKFAPITFDVETTEGTLSVKYEKGSIVKIK